jgi:hypothetical protein
MRHLAAIADKQGLAGFNAQVMRFNTPMRRLIEGSFKKWSVVELGPDGVSITARFEDLLPEARRRIGAREIAGAAKGVK